MTNEHDHDDEVLFPDNEDQNQQTKKQSDNLPPLAQADGVNLWVNEDKNGDVYFSVDMPGHESVRVFVRPELKEQVNRLVDYWEEQREKGGEQQ